MNFELNPHLDPRTRLNLAPAEETASSAAVNGGAGAGGGGIEREHMFDKVVTPSDVGKLNRLVIPKQHAERYFPLDTSTNDKGLLLNFEDRNGKSWRFRYSYWNSSQSYVMTKGWSRFVKEKRLDAGDIVSFQRGVGEIGREHLYIDWRRRPEVPIDHLHHNTLVIPMTGTSSTPWGSLVWRSLDAAATRYNQHPVTLMHHEMPRTNNNYSNNNNNNNNNKTILFKIEGRKVSPRLGDNEMERRNDQMEQEYFSNGGTSVVQEEFKTTRNITNYDDDNGEENITPLKKSRLRLFGVNI